MKFIGGAVLYILIMIITNKKLSKLVKGMAKPVKLSAEISVLVPCLVCATVILLDGSKCQRSEAQENWKTELHVIISI